MTRRIIVAHIQAPSYHTLHEQAYLVYTEPLYYWAVVGIYFLRFVLRLLKGRSGQMIIAVVYWVQFLPCPYQAIGILGREANLVQAHSRGRVYPCLYRIPVYTEP